MDVVGVGWDRPLGGGGSGEWDWWVLAGIAAVVLFILTARRTFPLALSIGLSALGGLVLADLTHAWGVVPVWSGLILIALSRNLRRGRRRPQV